MELPLHDRKRWLVAIGGVVAFLAVGIAVLPALTRSRREPIAESMPQAEVAPAPRVERAASSPSPDESAPDVVAATSPTAHTAAALNAEPIEGLSDFDCMIAPGEVVEIGSSITGLIDEILVERADYVEADQVVVKLESSVEHATVRLAAEQARRDVEIKSSQANLVLQKKRRSRARKLFEGKSLSVEAKDQVDTEALLAYLDLKRAKKDHDLKKLQLDQAQAALNRHTIRSPISGYVVDRLMSQGEVVDEETILRIAQVDPLRVEVILPATMFGRITPGSHAQVFTESAEGEPLSAEVEIVDRIIDGPSGTFGARLALPNPDERVPAGLRCQVRFLNDESETLAALAE